MTKEELKKEAEEKASIYFDSLEVDNGNVSDTPFSAYDVFVAYEKGALEFAEPREKRIAELESQIEKMRNCANCKNYNGNEGFCVLGSGYGYNCNLEKWEIKEND